MVHSLKQEALKHVPHALKEKSELLGLNKWLGAIPRNLKILFELSDMNEKAKEVDKQ